LVAYGLFLALGFVVNAGLNPTGMPMFGPTERSLVGAVDAGWYLRLLIMLYVFLPLFHASVRSLETKRLALPVIISIGAFALLIDFQKLAPLWIDLQFHPQFWYFILYPIIGYLIHDRKALAGIRSVWLGTAFVCALALHTSLMLMLSDRPAPWTMWYDSSFLLVASSVVFEAFRRAASGIRPNVLWNTLAAIGRLAFGIYIVHLFIMYFWYPSLKSFGFLEFVYLSASTTLAASIVVAWLLLRVPGLRTILR
jgi:surface polysaccharide O-acyltransferase-like enzyme